MSSKIKISIRVNLENNVHKSFFKIDEDEEYISEKTQDTSNTIRNMGSKYLNIRLKNLGILMRLFLLISSIAEFLDIKKLYR